MNDDLMGINQKTTLLFLLLALPHVCTITKEDCSSLPDKSLSCYNDYNRNITCVWSGTYLSDHLEPVCMIHAARLKNKYGYSNCCKLEPVDISRPKLMKCSVVFKHEWIFQSFHVLTINVSCNTMRQSLITPYYPSCHIKLNPPPKPDINCTTVSWSPQDTKHKRIKMYSSELQWKQEDQSWSDPPLSKQCEWDCNWTAKLPDELTQVARYDVRIRVRATEYSSAWSDWSPTASWVSPNGRAKPSPSDVSRVILGIFACAVPFVLLLILFKMDKTTWIYIAKKIRGPPLPNPGKSFLQDEDFQNWRPHLTSEYFRSFLKPVEIVSVEVTSTLDAVAPKGSEATLPAKMGSKFSDESTSSSFFNPIYSHFSLPAAPVSLLTAGNLEACDAGTPYGPVGCQDEDEHAEQDMDEVRGKEADILKLLSKGNDSELISIISDYEKVEKHCRLQSLDSGVCSGEEVSQESLEADSINVTDCQDEGSEDKEERKGGNGKEVDFLKQFSISGGVFNKGSIQVCSGYEQVHRLHSDIPGLPSPDSIISSRVEEQVTQEESLEDLESTSLLFPPLAGPFSGFASSLSSFTPMLSGSGLSVQPLPSHTLERIVLKSANHSVEPSGDGYLPVRQEQT